jgi:acetyl esterase/lipase
MLRKLSLAFALLALICLATPTPAPAHEPEEFPLWPNGAPGAFGNEPGQDKFHSGDIPTLTLWRAPADHNTGAAVVICPGGGYAFLATEHEGEEVARWLNSLGVNAVMLKYRIGPRYKHPAPLQDAQRALRTVRARAKDWAIDPGRVGILGFSAGGHLAATAATHFDPGDSGATDPVERLSSRPDFAVLVYAVTSLDPAISHGGSLKNLLGDNPDPALLENLSNEKQVTKDTPPTFLAHTGADTAVPAQNSIVFAAACLKHGVPVELHIFEKGVHGLGLGTGWADRIKPEPSFQAWPTLCAAWLESRGFLRKPDE